MKTKHILGSGLALAMGLVSMQAQAVPSFARQTGLACSSCHTVYPELTPFGRTFKLHGYTMTNVKQVDNAGMADKKKDLSINQIPPLSAMLQIAANYSKAQDPTTQINLPTELSMFYAGEISPHLGSFIQMTMDGGEGGADATFALDNTDIRYSNQSDSITYGFTLNNNPTVQDVWNSTQAWGYPFTEGAGIITTPAVNSLGEAGVIGAGAYADWGNGFYTELSLYRENHGSLDETALASGASGAANINGLAPYVRLAWNTGLSNGDNLMVGAYGMQATIHDSGSMAGEDKYTDTAIDAQYEHMIANSADSISAHLTYTNEDQTLDMSSPGDSPTLKSLRLDGIYHWGHEATATLAYTNNTGFNNVYDDTAVTAQFSYLPWQNTKFTLQYVAYSKLAGDSSSSVSDNNTTLLQAWYMW